MVQDNCKMKRKWIVSFCYSFGSWKVTGNEILEPIGDVSETIADG